MPLSIDKACSTFIPALCQENTKKVQIRTAIIALCSVATFVLTSLGAVLAFKRGKMDPLLGKTILLVIPTAGLGLAYKVANHLDKKWVKPVDNYGLIRDVELNIQSKIKHHSISGAHLNALCALPSSPNLQIELLNELDFGQLQTVRQRIGSNEFKALLPKLRNPNAQLWSLLEECASKTPADFSLHLIELKAKLKAENLQLFVFALRRVLREVGKYAAVQDDLNTHFPFIVSQYMRPSFWIPMAVAAALKPTVKQVDQDDSASFARVIDLFDGECPERERTDQQVLTDWQADVKFAVQMMDAETVKKVAESVATLPLECIGKNLAAIIETLQSISGVDLYDTIQRYESLRIVT